MPPNPLHSYQKIAAQTAPPGHLVQMLFDGAIRFLDRALASFQHKDPLEFNQNINNNIIRAQDILRHLDASLDLERGGELAATLRRLYRYMFRRLHESNMRKSRDGIEETIARLTVLRDAWSEMLRQQGHAPAPAKEPAIS
jgi:flagellar protein FliS